MVSTSRYVGLKARLLAFATLACALTMVALTLPPATPTLAAGGPSHFITQASVAPNPIQVGTLAVIAATVINSGASPSSALVDIEIYAADGTRAFQQAFDNQAFKAGQQRSYTVKWAVPSSASQGNYTLIVAVFGAGWVTLQPWSTWVHQGIAFGVGAATAVPSLTSVPPSPSPTSTPPPTATPTATRTATSIPTVATLPPTATPSNSFVTRQGRNFWLNAAPFSFVGANVYNAAGDPSNYECGPWMSNPDLDLDAWFGHVANDLGGKAVRFWAYQSYSNSGTNWTGVDRVMRLANQHNLKVIPVLENQWPDCTQGDYKLNSWYAGGYLKPYGTYTLSYKDYLGALVQRYKNEPAIAGWTLMNEAESKSVDGTADPDSLYTFARDMSGYIKSLDSNHLVTLGSMGGTQPGVGNGNYERIHSLSTIDFLEYHDYGANDQAIPGKNTSWANSEQVVLNDGQHMNKPVLVGEAGMTTCASENGSELETVASRAEKFDAKLNAFANAGGAGYLIWAWDPLQDCSYSFSPGDPLNGVLKKYAAGAAVSPGPTSTSAPEPASPAYSTTASSGPNPLTAGATSIITANVSSRNSAATSALVDIEVYGLDGTRQFQQAFDNQAFGAGQQRSFSVTWSVPTAAQAAYVVVVGIFGPGWVSIQPWSTWTSQATTLSIVAAAAPTPTPSPTPAPTATPVSLPAPGERAGFVARRGQDLYLNGARFSFVGTNAYNAANDPTVGFNCSRGQMQDPDVELDSWFSRMKQEAGISVVRIFGLQGYTAGGTNWTAFDRVFRLANKWNVKVIFTLENQWADVCTPQPSVNKGTDWYLGGYRQAYGGEPLAFRDYVGRVVARYKDEPAVLGWMLMNEAESTNTGALYAFAQDVSGYIKSLDPSHLVTVGVQGRYQPGTRGDDYRALHALSTIDFAEYHDYNAANVAFPGQSASGWGARSVTFDNSYGHYFAYDEGSIPARAWQELRGVIQPGATRLGIDFYPDPSNQGSVYIDAIQIGSRSIDFEDGGLDGALADGPVTLSNSTAFAYSGVHSLKATFNTAAEDNVFVPLQPADIGQQFSIRVYADAPVTSGITNSLAGRLQQMQAVGKPLIVGEAGMPVGIDSLGLVPETFDSRAQKLAAKMAALFAHRGAGYLIWDWEPTARTPMDFAFTSGDPLNADLARYAAQARNSP